MARMPLSALTCDVSAGAGRAEERWQTYILRRELGVEDVRGDDVSDGISGVEGSVVDCFLGLAGAIAAHPGDEEGVDGEDECDEVVADKQAAFVCFVLWQRD